MFDQIFKDAVVAGIPLLALIIGLVQVVKGFIVGVKGRLIAVLMGFLLGGGYELSKTGLPSDFNGWFTVIVFGLALGVTSFGLFDALKDKQAK
jgi:hypothetical protein